MAVPSRNRAAIAGGQDNGSDGDGGSTKLMESG